MNNYRLTRRADQDLVNIYLYTLENFGPAQAERYTRNIRQSFEMLAESPRMGRAANNVRPGLRRHEHDRHVIFYREDGHGILVIAVIHRMMKPDIAADMP